ncbi:DUF2938 domain-containing protein [Parahaliea aestuarii]
MSSVITQASNLDLLPTLLLGLGATAFMDTVALLKHRLFGIPSLDYAMVGRWLGHLPGGTFIHRPIGNSPSVAGEAPLGWAAHYLIGVAFACIFLLMVGPDWLQRPTLLPAITFGALTVLAPFLVLQPALGAGLAARNTPHPNSARLRSLFAHASFGLGLWASGLGCSLVLPPQG